MKANHGLLMLQKGESFCNSPQKERELPGMKLRRIPVQNHAFAPHDNNGKFWSLLFKGCGF